jgi:adenosylcobinamide-phosphate synthase
MQITVMAIGIGFLLDCCFGDPHWLWHPVRLIGWLIAKLEHLLRKCCAKTPRGERTAGIVMVVIVMLLSFGVPLSLLWCAQLVHPYVRLGLESIMCYQILALKSLRTESMKVHDRLFWADLEGARKAVSMIVGRDTKDLTEEQIIKAAVETVAENTSDGVIAPLFFLALGGAPFGFLYKAVNTMDSMVGYQNERYRDFGWCAAKLDDWFNWIPSRLAAVLMIGSAKIMGFDAKNARRIFRRDRFCHSSPNSAQTESVCAGALHIRLAGDAYYFGKLVHKETIGDPDRSVELQDIVRANQLLYGTAALMVMLIAILYGLWFGLGGLL